MVINIRKATKEDIPFIIKLIAADQLGKIRETYRDILPEKYYLAFEKINADVNQELIVVENKSEIIGTLQLTFLQYLTYKGGIRAQIEAVRIREDMRGKGIGHRMFEWAIDKARQRNAHLIQLTTDKKRIEAKGFYESVGFKATHEGMKLQL